MLATFSQGKIQAVCIIIYNIMCYYTPKKIDKVKLKKCFSTIL